MWTAAWQTVPTNCPCCQHLCEDTVMSRWGRPIVSLTAAWRPCRLRPALTTAHSDGCRRESLCLRDAQKGQGCFESAASNGRIRAVNSTLARFTLIGSRCSPRLSPGERAGSVSPLVVGELFTLSYATTVLLPAQQGLTSGQNTILTPCKRRMDLLSFVPSTKTFFVLKLMSHIFLNLSTE